MSNYHQLPPYFNTELSNKPLNKVPSQQPQKPVQSPHKHSTNCGCSHNHNHSINQNNKK